jgi:hypothetical protein
VILWWTRERKKIALKMAGAFLLVACESSGYRCPV